MNYNKGIKMVANYSDISAYDEFFQYCDEHNLTTLQVRILREILAQPDDWEISPSQIAKKFNKDRQEISLAINGNKTFKGLIEKLNGDLVVVFKSNGGNNRGHLFNAHKVYDIIYNMIMNRANGITNDSNALVEKAFSSYTKTTNPSIKDIKKFNDIFGKYLEIIHDKYKENYNEIIDKTMTKYINKINYPSDIVKYAEQSIGA